MSQGESTIDQCEQLRQEIAHERPRTDYQWDSAVIASMAMTVVMILVVGFFG
jgi:hypothetical protein